MRNPHMKFQDSSLNGLKVTVGTKSVTHPRTQARSKSNMPHQLFQSWGHKLSPPNNKSIWFCEIAWFPWQSIMRFQRIGVFLQK